MTPEEVRDWTRRSRAAQGLPPVIEDEAMLARLVVLAGLGPSSAAADPGDAGGGPEKGKGRRRFDPRPAAPGEAGDGQA